MPKSEIKYLGLDIHQLLDGEITADKVIKKANSRLKFLQRKGRYLNVYTKKLLVSALIQWAISNNGFRSDSLYEKKIWEDLVFNNTLPKVFKNNTSRVSKGKTKIA